MINIDQNNIFWALNRNKIKPNICDHAMYKQWENETAELKEQLIKKGRITYPTTDRINKDYWGENAPIVLSNYPYNNCTIYQCAKCHELFFHYLEDGGHCIQKRYRIINRELIDKKEYKPAIDTIIESKSYEYQIQKSPYGQLLLSICLIDVGVGIDVMHKLTKKEEELYYNYGIEKLGERMNDMKLNYTKYRVASWRSIDDL